jgi:hypothetical protein
VGIKIQSSSGLAAPGKRGYGRLVHKLRRYPRQAMTAVAFGIYEAMQVVMTDAKWRAPKDTHAMELSGYVAKPSMTAKSVSVESGFGGDSENYVVRVHETPGFAKTGETFFFRNALDAGEGLIRDTVQKWVSHFLKTGRLLPFPRKLVPEHPLEARVPAGIKKAP